MSRSGFSALEALIAVAVIAVALVPLLQLQSEFTRGVARQRAAYTEAACIQDALALLEDVNPMNAPSGTLPIGSGARMTWRAVPVTSETRATRRGTGHGNFIVRLYRLNVEVTDLGQGQRSQFAVDKVGWRVS